MLDELKHIIETFPGTTELQIEVRTKQGPRRIRLGENYRVAPCASLKAELVTVLGEAIIDQVA